MAQTREQQIKEIQYQTRMLNNLKKWIRNLIIMSSIGIVIAYWGLQLQQGRVFHIVGAVGLIFSVICVLCCVIIGLAFKNGKQNVEKIISLAEK